MYARARRGAVVVCLALSISIPGPVSARETAPKNPTVPPPTDAQLDNDMRYRAELGLRADRAYVKRLFDDARAGTIEATTEAGAILTPAEDALVRARTDAVDHVVRVADEYFEDHREVYAGMWIDQGRGLVGIGVTQDREAHAQALSTLVGDTSAIWHVHLKNFSLDYLLGVQRSIDLATADLRAQSVDISSTSIDEEQNKVYVGAASDTTTARELIETRFSAAPVVVVHEEHPVLEGVAGTDSPPFRGGQRITHPAETPGKFVDCTSAFVAYAVERLDAGIFNITYFLTTAGHCEQTKGVGSAGTYWTQGTTFVGQSQRNAFQHKGYADAMAIRFTSALRSHEVAVSEGDYRSIQCMMTTSVKQGQVEIISGAKTGGYRTGTLVRTNATAHYLDRPTGRVTTLVQQHQTNYFSQQGDSGASVFGTRECRYRAQGVHSGGSERNSPSVKYYTPIFNATKALGLAGVEVGP